MYIQSSPSRAISDSTRIFVACAMATRVMTAPTPMMIPSIDSPVRTLFRSDVHPVIAQPGNLRLNANLCGLRHGDEGNDCTYTDDDSQHRQPGADLVPI